MRGGEGREGREEGEKEEGREERESTFILRGTLQSQYVFHAETKSRTGHL